jgi:hypothetical protein
MNMFATARWINIYQVRRNPALSKIVQAFGIDMKFVP